MFDLKAKENASPFVKDFISKYGFPQWKAYKSKIRQPILARAEDQTQDTIVSIPIMDENSTKISSILKVRLNGEVMYKLFKDYAYALNGFSKYPGRLTPSADDIVSELLNYEKELLGRNVYRVTDKRLFDYWDSDIPRPDTFYMSFDRRVSCTNTIAILDWVPGGFLESCPPGQDHCIKWVQVVVDEITVSGWCSEDDPYENGGGGEDDGGWGNDPTNPGEPGGGGGSSGGSNPPANTGPCGLGWDPIVQLPDGTWNDICLNSPLEPEKADQNGFYQSRISALEQLLSISSDVLLPCDEILALETFGSMWQAVGSYTAPLSVVERLNSIRTSHPNWIVDNYNLENIENAYGPKVNCDFFPVKIPILPNNPETGNQFTARDFLEYFRTHINTFINPYSQTNFQCDFSVFDDCDKWYSPFEDCLGALCSVEIHPGTSGYPSLYNSGSIIVSDYHHGVYPGGYESNWFTVSTLETPFDGEHPVAGNRRFGIYNTIENPNEWTFFTMGVDRTWDFWDAIINQWDFGFNEADALWSGVQDQIIQFCNFPANMGQASLFAQRSYIARPRWSDVEKFLRKEITFQQLRQIMGC